MVEFSGHKQSTIRSTREYYYATMCPTDRESVSADLTKLGELRE